MSRYSAARFVGGGRIEVGSLPIPEPGPGQLLIRVKANALCGSERGQYLEGAHVTPGHEAAGIVAASGPGTRIKEGTPGVVFLMDFCGECRCCRSGATNQCLQKRGDYGFNRNGGYSEYMVIHENVFFPIDPGIDMAEATMLLDVMGTGGHAIKRGLLVHTDIRSIAVAGAGPIGLGVLAMAKLLLGDQIPVFVADTNAYRLDLVPKFGGIPVDAANSSWKNRLADYGLTVADLGVDTSGRQAARQALFLALEQRGVFVCVGHGEELHLQVSRDLIAAERAVLGSEYFRYDELPGNLELLRRYRGYLSPLITHRFPLERIGDAFQLFMGPGETGKVVIES